MKKLIPALALLLVSATLMSTASYAWFSMNTTVTANGMQVTAKTDNAFLIISAGTTLSGSAITAAGSLNASLYPTAPVVTLDKDNVYTETSWGTARSSNPTEAQADATVTALTAGTELAKYVAKQSFMVGKVADSGTVAHDLKLASLTADYADGIAVVVVCGDHVFTYDEANQAGGTDVLATPEAVTDTGVQVDVYVFIDGKNDAVTTSNAANLGGSVSMTFSIDA